MGAYGFRGPLYRGHCAVCGKIVAVRKDGTAHWHGSKVTEDPSGYGRCRGAGAKANPLAKGERP